MALKDLREAIKEIEKMMPLMVCKNCEHWTRWSGATLEGDIPLPIGRCTKTLINNGSFTVDDGFAFAYSNENDITTGEDFGCIHFSIKD